MQTGIHEISNEEYHSSVGYSRSAIMEFKRSPRHFWHRYMNSKYVKPKQSADMAFGEALHCALLEPYKFNERYVIEEKINRQSKAGKLAHAAMLERNKNKIVLSPDDRITIHDMVDTILSIDDARELINGAHYEKSFYWIDPDTQILCKVRPDIWHENFIVDYKTTKDASERKFRNAIYDYGYYMQFAMMQEAFKHVLNKDMQHFIYLAQEKEAPYLPAIYQLDPAALEFGVNEFKNILQQIKYCAETYHYPGYPTRLISLPAWSTL